GVGYGEKFSIGTPQADEIESVLLMKTPSPQHAIDSDQRSVVLDFTRTGGNTLEAVAPPSGTVSPPGFYYLVVNKTSPRGPIPSVARIVRVGAGSDLSEALQPYADDTAAPTGGSATTEVDHSNAAKAKEAARQAASEAPAPINGPVALATQVAGTAYEQLSAVPTASRTSVPSPGP
ncbi:MAG TPA: galactose oxidase early set domain-containing protein, partial [Acidimicrobiia bacterium]